MTTEEKIQSLVSLGEKQGFITYDNFNETFSNSGFSAEKLEGLYTDLLLAGVQIIDESPRKDTDPET